MKNILLLGATFLVASAVTVLDEEWNNWKSKYERVYTNRKEEALRREIWEANWQKVLKHNRLAEQGLVNYTMAMNKFADKSVQELINKNRPCSGKETIKPTHKPAPSSSCETKANGKYPEHVDWRESGCVTPVKESGLICDSWWAFAALSVLESRYCIKNKILLAFSEQQLVDCDDENDGCCGGDFKSAFKYVSEQGIMPNKDYEYTQSKSSCLYKPDEALQINITKYYEMSDEQNIAQSVAVDGPVAAMFYVTDDLFLYNGGIYDEDCFQGQGFGMTIVGYGTSCETDYWILKNSWGKDWGEDGYVRVKRNENYCSIADFVKASDIADPA